MTQDEVRIVVETMAPIVREYVSKAVTELVVRVTAAEVHLKSMEELGERLAAVRERLAAVEARPVEPGPEGPPGPPGSPGSDGKPGLRYRGVYDETKAYEAGDVVTWGGSAWHCDGAGTTKPADGAKGWQLIVKKGRDGKGAA